MTTASTPLAPIASKESFIERFGDWIEGIFHKSEDIYNTLEETAKKAAVWGSGLIAVVNTQLNALPTMVIDLIKQKFPDLSIDVVHGFLDILRTKIDNAASQIPLTLEDAIAWLQNFLANHKSTSDSIWGVISATAGQILATLFSPETAIEKFLSIGLWIYHLIVKPHVEAA